MTARALGLALAAALVPALAAADGVVVTSVAPDKAAARAGLVAGDVLERWRQGDASGPLASPFDLEEAEREYAPRGAVRLTGKRGDAVLDVALHPDDWGIGARPVGEDEAWRQFEAAKGATGLDAMAAAVEAAVRAAEGRPLAQAQMLVFLGGRLKEAERLRAAHSALRRALEARERGGSGPLAMAALADPISRLQLDPREVSIRRLQDALSAHERLAPESLAFVRILDALGWRVGGPQQTALVARALAIVERVAPETTLHAALLFSAAWSTLSAEGVSLLTRALRIQERVEPVSRQTGITLSFLGRQLDYAGDAALALEYQERAVRMLERIAPDTGDHSAAVNNLALYWRERGDLVKAEVLYRQSLAVEERNQPQGFGVARAHYNLGLVLFARRDFEQAETHLKRAWDLIEAHGYGRNLAIRILYTRARILRERKELGPAEELLRRAMALAAEFDSAQLYNSRHRLAEVLADRGRDAEAEALFRENLAHALSWGLRFVTAEAHVALGAFALERDDLDTAERQYRAALELLRLESPETMERALASHALGVIARRRARKDDALAFFEEAVAALEAQGRRLGGTEEKRAAFRAHYQQLYRDLEEILLELGREAEAFGASERGRARGLAALLASRDVAPSAAVPAELAGERRRANTEYDRTFAALNAPGLDAAAREARRREHEAARIRLDGVRARLRSADPRAGALREPEPMSLDGVARALEPGTLLLAFSLGEASGRVYAVGPGAGEFAVFPVASGRAALSDAVRAFRETVESRRSRVLRGAMDARARALTTLLVGAAEAPIRRARRLLVVPDGALHLLPFAALRDPSDPSRYLVEAKPISTVSSMTLHEVLARPVPRQGARPVVAFGDPAYGAKEGPADPSLSRARREGLKLEPLPATRVEVEALKRLSPAATLWLGDEATEERAKALGPQASVIHFACHGFVDEDLPLESGLALTPPPGGGAGRENGLLQAWEVFERVRVDADLVTLSACQTGLGKEMGGEGLLGLTWAFQYAGARSVLASLWEVGDASTAELMQAFYTRLAAGAPTAEALRRAQIALLRRPATSAPYYWAAFVLSGASR